MPCNYQTHVRLAVGGLMAIALTSPSTASLAIGLAQPPAQRPSVEVALQEGEVSVTGEEGQYTGQVLVRGTVDTAWQVLTDYNNFKNFMPNVAESRILETDGNRKVFEQVNVFRVFVVTRRTRVVIAATESYPQQIAFNVIEGDVGHLQGSWRLQSVGANQVLITHQVSIEPQSASTRGLFFSLYKNSLKDTLAALRQEIGRRSAG